MPKAVLNSSMRVYTSKLRYVHAGGSACATPAAHVKPELRSTSLPSQIKTACGDAAPRSPSTGAGGGGGRARAASRRRPGRRT